LRPLVGAGVDGAGASREESFTAWRRFLEAMAARRPTVLVIEDLHWADDALLEFLEHLLDWSTPVPLFVLCTARPELFERQPSWGGGKRNATTISLSPLSAEEVARLVQVLLDRTLLPAETQAALLERAGGNPLYAEQFARMLNERGGVEGLRVPETVQALVAARLDTLRAELKGLLHDAAVVGRIFWSGAAAAVGGRDREAVRRDLNELVRREFVRPLRASSMEGEEEFSFWHGLVRDVAYQQIPRSPRADKHLAVAAWVEELGADRLEDHAEILVHHYGQAHELARSAGNAQQDVEDALVRFLLLAGDRATQLDAEAAEGYFRRAVSLSEGDELARARALGKLAPVLALRADFDEASRMAEEAVVTLRDRDNEAAAALLNFLASNAWARGETPRAKQLDEEAIEMLEQRPSPELVRGYGLAAHRAAIGGRYDEADALMEKGFELAAQLGVEDDTALLNARATVRAYRGDPGCLDDLREAIDRGRRIGLGRSTAIGMNNLADGLAYFVGLREALAQWDEAMSFSRSRGLTALCMWQRGERLRALFHLGEWEELRHEADELVAGEEQYGGSQIGIFARTHLAGVLVHRGDIAGAAANVDVLLPRARESGDPQVLVPGLTIAALVAAVAGDEETALEHVKELEALTRTSFAWRGYGLLWPARIAVASERVDLAEAFLDGAGETSAWDRCTGGSARALLAESRGREDAAAVMYREAAEHWAAFGSVIEQAYALIGASRCGDAKAGRDGEAIFLRLGAAPVLAVAA
jgi:tetratricopeptide (TPR) repeat protein